MDNYAQMAVEDACARRGGIGRTENQATTLGKAPAGPLELTHQAFSASAELASRINWLADKLVGPVPQNAEKAGDCDGPGVLDELAGGARRSLRNTSAGHDALTRLERAFSL